MKIRNVIILISVVFTLTLISLWMGKMAYYWFPPQATAESLLIDKLFSFLVTLGTFIFLGVIGTLAYSLIFHRAKEFDTSDGPPIEGNITLEIIWTGIPIVLVFWIAVYSYQIYEEMGIQGSMEHIHLQMPMAMKSAYAGTINSIEKPIEEPIETIDVVAKQWVWVFHYPKNNITSTEVHLPVAHRIRMKLTSENVIHGFYIPTFRVKQDIIPKQTINLEFTPIRVGQYRLRDSEYSGTYFAAMQTDVIVESIEDYHHWLDAAAKNQPTPAYNQAFAEYEQASKQPYHTGWPTIPPAAPPIVNYSTSKNESADSLDIRLNTAGW